MSTVAVTSQQLQWFPSSDIAGHRGWSENYEKQNVALRITGGRMEREFTGHVFCFLLLISKFISCGNYFLLL
jgi:hypothetical protein